MIEDAQAWVVNVLGLSSFFEFFLLICMVGIGIEFVSLKERIARLQMTVEDLQSSLSGRQ